MITTKDVEHIAELSRLEFNQQELESFKLELSSIIEYVNSISSVNTSQVNLMVKTTNAEFDLRQDTPRQQFTQSQAVENAPVKKNGAFVVPGVLD